MNCYSQPKKRLVVPVSPSVETVSVSAMSDDSRPAVLAARYGRLSSGIVIATTSVSLVVTPYSAVSRALLMLTRSYPVIPRPVVSLSLNRSRIPGYEHVADAYTIIRTSTSRAEDDCACTRTRSIALGGIGAVGGVSLATTSTGPDPNVTAEASASVAPAVLAVNSRASTSPDALSAVTSGYLRLILLWERSGREEYPKFRCEDVGCV